MYKKRFNTFVMMKSSVWQSGQRSCVNAVDPGSILGSVECFSPYFIIKNYHQAEDQDNIKIYVTTS